MIKFIKILAALFCATAPVAAIVEAPASRSSEEALPGYRLGKESVAAVRSAYENGEYNEFLSEMDESYKGTDLSGLIQMRQKDVPLSFQEKWEQQFSALQKVRNQELLESLEDTDDSAFANKVRGAASSLLTPEQEKAISRLNSFIAMAPNTGANDDENALIALDLEYEYKILHANVPLTNPENQKAHSLALRMEKMDKMVEASKNFENMQLKTAVGIARDTLDARLSSSLDGNDLNAMLRNNAAPSNGTEERVFSILSLYQGKFSDLLKQLENENS
jgi:hypothetical protein